MKLISSKHFKTAVSTNYLALCRLLSNNITDVLPNSVKQHDKETNQKFILSVFKLQQQFEEVFSIAMGFLPTHVTISNNTLAFY